MLATRMKAPGVIRGLQFTGDGYINFGQVNPLESFRARIWFKTTHDANASLFDERNETFRGIFTRFNADGTFQGQVRNAAAAAALEVVSVRTVNDGELHVVEHQWIESTGTNIIRLDGTFENSVTDAAYVNDVTDIMAIGIRSGGVTGGLSNALYFTGTIYEFQVWDKNNIVVGWWPMNEGSGVTVYDWSGNGKDGTVTNGTWVYL